ncbi:hypothetical protein O181_033708 [Austropuccinia psidii MF-1]|uniref:Uncharacterized protein n=1 Tax=Austropuccinia psidii MF-1 TaxID=1389203 RepID=A0A9Q3D421_9BASI|nr:hypothetical protein [Austropuccinia psidii MF-1]
MLADKHTRNTRLLSDPSDHMARGVPAEDAYARTPLWLTMMKVFPSRNGPRNPKQAGGNNSGRLALSSQASICPPPLVGHHAMVTSLLDWSEVIIRPMKDGNGKRKFELGPIVTMGFKRQKQNPPDTPQQDSPVQCMPLKQTPPQPTSGLSGTQWPEDLFCEPSQHNEPPIPGLIPSPEQPEDIVTCEPEPEVAPTQSMEEPFALPATPHLIIIIDNTPVRSPPPISPAPTLPPSTDLPPIAADNPTASSPWCQAHLIPTMMLSRNSPTCDQHQ